MRLCLLDNQNYVINVVESSIHLPNSIDGTGRGNIGDLWDGENFIPQPPKPIELNPSNQPL